MLYPENKEFEKLLDRVKKALGQHLPFCIYRKPNQDVVKSVFQNSENLLITTDFNEKGFVFAPFDWHDNTVLLRPDEVLEASYAVETNPKNSIDLIIGEGKKSSHLTLVVKGKEAIEKRELTKVVLSQKFESKLQISPEKLIVRILNAYPAAFCYLFYHPKIGFWCGASPETLLEVHGNTLKTMSLAGTLPFDPDSKPNWSSKEFKEQSMVSDFIVDRLSKELDNIEIKGPESVKAGQLWHLKTTIKGKLTASDSIKKIIGLLHPTPAVCGLPSDMAKSFIVENEDYDRKYYTGFLGELRMENTQKTSLFVNLRCMELTDSGTSIYVGGGITKASVPEKEWEELLNKSKTMLGLF